MDYTGHLQCSAGRGEDRGRVREREEIEVKKERGNEGRRGERGQ
jgi:hypothetical protein